MNPLSPALEPPASNDLVPQQGYPETPHSGKTLLPGRIVQQCNFQFFHEAPFFGQNIMTLGIGPILRHNASRSSVASSEPVQLRDLSGD